MLGTPKGHSENDRRGYETQRGRATNHWMIVLLSLPAEVAYLGLSGWRAPPSGGTREAQKPPLFGITVALDIPRIGYSNDGVLHASISCKKLLKGADLLGFRD